MRQDAVNAGRDVSASSLRGRAHACAIVDRSGGELEWLLPMLDEVTPSPVRTVRICDDALAELDAATVAAWRAEHPGRTQSDVLRTGWASTYLAGGVFQQHAMLSRIDRMIEVGHDDGFPLVRIVADMAWAAGDVEGVGDLVEYESRLNTIIDPVAAEVVCVYDLAAFARGVVAGLGRSSNRLNPGFLLDVIRVHPFLIAGGKLRANEYYVPPDSFLPELASRRAHRASS